MPLDTFNAAKYREQQIRSVIWRAQKLGLQLLTPHTA
jgi:hypothetical protein